MAGPSDGVHSNCECQQWVLCGSRKEMQTSECIANSPRLHDGCAVIWWDWKTSQRLILMAAVLCIAALPWIVIGWSTSEWHGLLGGTAFLFFPLIVGWLLFVGLTTGRMPSAYGRSEQRAVSPTWFWITGGLYAALLLFFLWIIFGVVVLGL